MSSDFLHLDSGDSDYFSTPQTSRIRDRDLFSSFTPQQKSNLRSELKAVYDKLDTPLRGAKANKSLGGLDRHHSEVNGSKPIAHPVELTRERMKLSNIIDSETTADDTGGSFFLKSTNIGGAEANQAEPLYSTKMRANDVELTSEVEESPFEFTQPIHISSTNIKDPSYINTAPANTLGKLLQIDSASDNPNTPQSNIKEFKSELDQSKTRFRQTIMELVHSSPLNVGTKGEILDDFRELVQRGTNLGSRLMKDLETTEKMLPGNEHQVFEELSLMTKESAIKAPPKVIRPMTVEELLLLSPQGPTNQQDGQLVTGESTKKQLGHVQSTSRFRQFLARLFWAISVLIFLIIIDTVVQCLVLRQEMGIPIIDFDWIYSSRDSLKSLGSTFLTKFGTSLNFPPPI